MATELPLPEERLRLSGSVRLLLVINLGSFVHPDDTDLFRHVRGSEHYAAALRTLHPAAPVLLDEHETQIEQEAYTLRIFRSRLLANHFFPTYRLAWDADLRAQAASYGTPTQWTGWTTRLRLTRGGLALVTLEQEFENQPLLACSERLLELQEREPSDRQGQWSIGLLLLSTFLESIGHRLVVGLPHERQLTIRFGQPQLGRHSVWLDRFVVHNLRQITDGTRLLAPDELKADAAPTLAAFMEGTLIQEQGQRRLPRYAVDQASELMRRDTSSWDEELCLFTGEGALIYCPLIERGVAYVGGPRGLSGQAYKQYWQGILRGIEHVVVLRAEIQQAERRTTSLLGDVPMLTRRVNEGDLSAEEIAQIDHLAVSLADIFDSVPELRSMAVSSSAFRADYVRRKFEALMYQLDVNETLELVNTNVEQLNFFLSYYSDMRLQWQGQRTNDTSVLISEVVLFLALSSFAADTIQVWESAKANRMDDIAIVGAILALVAILVVTGWLRRVWRLRQRRARSLL